MECRDSVPSALGRDLRGYLRCFLKIPPPFDQLDAERLHGGILLDAVAVRNDDHRWNSIAQSSEADGLSVIPPGGGYDSGRLSRAGQFVEVDKASTQLECTCWRMVLVLYPHCCSGSCVQQRPPVLWSRRHRLVDERGGGFEVRE